MYNINYEEDELNYSKEPIEQRYKYLNENVNEIYSRDRRYYPITNYKNIESNISSLNKPSKYLSKMNYEPNPLTKSAKIKRLQNENATVYRVSPYHYQYISRVNNNYNNFYKYNNYQRNENYYVDKNTGDQSYNIERERKFRNYNQFLNSRTINRHQNYLERNLIYNRNNINQFENRNNNEIIPYKKINNNRDIKYNTPNEFLYREKRNKRYSDYHNEIPFSQSEQIINRNYINENDDSNYDRNWKRYYDNINLKRDNNRRYILKRNNSDLNYIYNRNDRYSENERYGNMSERQYERNYEQNNYDDNFDYDNYNEAIKYYKPENDDYKKSRYENYTNNCNLNSSMRYNRSENWRLPPIYNDSPNKYLRNKIYSIVNDADEVKGKFFN